MAMAKANTKTVYVKRNSIRCKVWIVRPSARIAPERLHSIKYLNRVGSKTFIVHVNGMADSKTAQEESILHGAENGDYICYHPIGSEGQTVDGQNFRPQVTLLQCD